MYIGSVLSFVKFGGQTSNNVHGVRKVCLETTMSVYACFVEFYVFVLDKINVRGPKVVYYDVWVGNVWENIAKNHPRVLEAGHFMSAKISQDSPNNGGNRRPVGEVSLIYT